MPFEVRFILDVWAVVRMRKNLLAVATPVQLLTTPALYILLSITGGLSKEELRALIGGAVTQKKFSLGGQEDMYSLAKSKNRPMILIGG
jgi:hypothetical protein